MGCRSDSESPTDRGGDNILTSALITVEITGYKTYNTQQVHSLSITMSQTYFINRIVIISISMSTILSHNDKNNILCVLPGLAGILYFRYIKRLNVEHVLAIETAVPVKQSPVDV